MWSARGMIGRGLSLFVAPAVERAVCLPGQSSTTDAPDGGVQLRPRHVVVYATLPYLRGGYSIEGQVDIESDFMFDGATQTSTSSVEGQRVHATRNVSRIEFARGHEVTLRSLNSRTLWVRIAAPSRTLVAETVELMRTVLALAADSNPTWICWRSQFGGRGRLGLAGRTADPRRNLRKSIVSGECGPGALTEFTKSAWASEQARPGTCEDLRALEIGRMLGGSITPAWLLLSAVLLENLARAACRRLQLRRDERAIPKEMARLVIERLKELECDASLRERVSGLLDSTGNARGADWLHALRARYPGVLTPDDVKSWRRLRNPLAHGETRVEARSALDDYYRVCNATNKVACLLLEYRGPYADHGPESRGVRRLDITSVP